MGTGAPGSEVGPAQPSQDVQESGRRLHAPSDRTLTPGC